MDWQPMMLLGAGALVLLQLNLLLVRSRRRQNRRPTSAYLEKRMQKGRMTTAFGDLRSNPEKFRENFHMNVSTFEALYTLVEPHLLPKKDTHPKNGIPPIEKLIAVLEFLAGGALQRHIASNYRISKQHFGFIIDEVCNAISTALKDEIPGLTSSSFSTTALNFEQMWNFPNCLGAIDGKHIAIKCPQKAGSLFYNFKGFHSIVLMAVADANYGFLYADIGAFGSEGDASVFGHCELGKSVYDNSVTYPEDRQVGNHVLPYVFVADDAFPLHTRLLKPYVPKRGHRLPEKEQIFNYRLSRARRCVENAFGILCSRWFCLGRTMLCSPDRAQKITMACCYLHNYLLKKNRETYCPSNFADREATNGLTVEGEWRKHLPPSTLHNCNLQAQAGRQNSTAKQIRNDFADYFATIGAVEWQNAHCFL